MVFIGEELIIEDKTESIIYTEELIIEDNPI